MGYVLIVTIYVLLNRRHFHVAAFALLWVAALISVRLIAPAVNWPDRAPEWIYAQQWYPALPGMVWLMVAAVRCWTGADASHDERCA